MTREVLVGSTGFVGGNLLRAHRFGLAVHSTDVGLAYGARPDLVVYAGVPSAMFLANENPEADLELMRQARENIRRIGAKAVVLISTIAVYADSRGRDERDEPEGDGMGAYGSNRRRLERWVREDYGAGALIVRLPAIYGNGLKKNFIHDLIHPAPPMLREEKWLELSAERLVADSYGAPDGSGFCRMLGHADRRPLDAWFASQAFNALCFTDSRSRFQFYGLDRLWDDASRAVREGLSVLNLATPPVSAAEVYERVRGGKWENELRKAPFDYDMRTVHSPAGDGYLLSKGEELEGIEAFVRGQHG